MAGRHERDARVVAEPGAPQLVADPDRRNAWTLLVDDSPQSFVDLDDPTYLRFAYMRWIAALIDAMAPPARPLDVLHLGGGALTLARYTAVTRPGSRQRVVERDATVTNLVRSRLPLPRRADVRVRAADARAATEATRDARYDLVIGDVYHDARMPRTLASTDFAAHVARVLRPDGYYAVNLADLPPLTFSRAQAATLAAVFPDVAAVSDPAILRLRRPGNVVLFAARAARSLPVAQLVPPGNTAERQVLHGPDLVRFTGGARPVTDATAEDSPQPPARVLRPRRPVD